MRFRLQLNSQQQVTIPSAHDMRMEKVLSLGPRCCIHVPDNFMLVGTTMAVKFTRSDLEFILEQIKFAENNQPPVSPHLAYGLREVAGTDNNSVPGQGTFGSADQLFPHTTDSLFRTVTVSAGMLSGPLGAFAAFAAPDGTVTTTYASTSPSSFVIDADPRIISNLITDQIDFVALHTYAELDTVFDPKSWDWRLRTVAAAGRAAAMMDAALAETKRQYQAARDHLDSKGLSYIPIIIGETGWNAVDVGRLRFRASPVNQKMYLDRLESWVAQARMGGSGPRQAFWFEADRRAMRSSPSTPRARRWAPPPGCMSRWTAPTTSTRMVATPRRMRSSSSRRWSMQR